MRTDRAGGISEQFHPLRGHTIQAQAAVVSRISILRLLVNVLATAQRHFQGENTTA